MKESTNTKTIDGTRLLDSLTSKCKRIACTLEMCSKTISEIVLKMVRQNMRKVPYILHHEMYWTETIWGQTGSSEQFSSLSLWKLKKMIKEQIVLDIKMHDGTGSLSLATPHLCGI